MITIELAHKVALVTRVSKGISDFRSTLPRFTPEALKANQALINLLGSIAEQKRATPA